MNNCSSHNASMQICTFSHELHALVANNARMQMNIVLQMSNHDPEVVGKAKNSSYHEIACIPPRRQWKLETHPLRQNYHNGVELGLKIAHDLSSVGSYSDQASRYVKWYPNIPYIAPIGCKCNKLPSSGAKLFLSWGRSKLVILKVGVSDILTAPESDLLHVVNWLS